MSDARGLDEGWTRAARAEYVEAVRAGEEPSVPEPGREPPGAVRAGEFGAEWVADEVDLPTCWERTGLPKGFCGPVWYRREFDAGDAREATDALLRFGAVSYHCTVWLNGERVATHEGMWDAFDVAVGDRLEAENTLVLEVHKPGDHFPVGESLAGFVPFVTTTFGGPWQGVSLDPVSSVRVDDVHVTPDRDRERFAAEVSLATHGDPPDVVDVSVSVAGHAATATGVDPGGSVTVEVPVPGAAAWSPDDPALHDLRVSVRDVGTLLDVHEERVGLRDVEREDDDVLLNGAPVFPRGALHWCAYPDLIAPTPDEARVRAEFERLQALGYDTVKLCLVVPPEVYFRVADEMGMMLWVELPMWNPEVTPAVRERLPGEYRRILERVRNHPSVVAYTLGCELDTEADADLLEELYGVVKDATGSELVRDNSGSAEAYGGVAQEFADYYDYHFYAETNQFPDLVGHFLPDWRETKPLLFGEYCDSDTFRDVAALREDLDYDLWWAEDDPVVNPQGVRWAYEVVHNEERLAEFPLAFDVETVRRRSYAQSTEYRKDVVEATRRLEEPSGYVVTNVIDTPISTAGMLDDRGELKFDPETWRQFNRETVVSLERGRRRVWRHGGDRPQYLDEFAGWAGDRLWLTPVVSHYGEALTDAALRWSLRGPEGVLEEGAVEADRVEPATPHELPDLAVDLPDVAAPTACELEVELVAGDRVVSENGWTYWALPAVDYGDWSFTLLDGRDRFPGIERHAEGVTRVVDPDAVDPAAGDVVVTTRWTDRIEAWLEAGAGVVALLDAGDPLAEPMPFWREGIGLVHDHPVAAALPHEGYPGIQFKGVTPEAALDADAVTERLDADLDRVVSRLDAREFTTAAYALAGTAGDGRLALTTFKLGGGFARQPLGAGTNVVGTALLDALREHVS